MSGSLDGSVPFTKPASWAVSLLRLLPLMPSLSSRFLCLCVSLSLCLSGCVCLGVSRQVSRHDREADLSTNHLHPFFFLPFLLCLSTGSTDFCSFTAGNFPARERTKMECEVGVRSTPRSLAA